MRDKIIQMLILAMLIGLLAANLTYIVMRQAQQRRVLEEAQLRVAELEGEVAELRQELAETEGALAMVQEENVALLEELEYLRWVLEDPLSLFTGELREFTPEEETELMGIAMSEAGNQGVIGKALVMLTVLNRQAKNGQSIHDIIYAPNQYYTAGMRDGDEECDIALLMVSAGWDGSQGALYFSNQGYNACAKVHLFKFGAHYFGK